MGATNQPGDAVNPGNSAAKLRQAARGIHVEWEQAWNGIERDIRARGEEVRCRPGCASCCFTRKFCTVSEGLVILDYLEKKITPEQQERYRLRVESCASSLRKLRADGFCDSEDAFFRAGGMECPFLERGRCFIYEVRPLSCRALNVLTETSVTKCRECPAAINSIECESKQRQLRNSLEEKEGEIGAPSPPKTAKPWLLPEVMSYLWEEKQTPSVNFSREALAQRLATRGTERDETWQDDFSDFQALRAPLTLPAEGDYNQYLTLIKQKFENHELYGEIVSGEGMPEFCSLYNRNPGCTFDWTTRKFAGGGKEKEEYPYTIWMSDGLQERLMMWEAAKRSRGRVLCGGLGLGIFPQLALSLPRVDSIDIIERDPAVIHLIERAWKKQPWPRIGDCRIRLAPVEEYLETTTEKYDTVYIDTWDAIYNEYLPHLNELTRLAKPVLSPGGEVLLWAFDMMVRDFLQTVQLVIERRDKYQAVAAGQLKNIERQYPLLHRLVLWLKSHPQCSGEELLTEGYRLATKESRNLGLLILSRQPGAQALLEQKYSRHSPFMQ